MPVPASPAADAPPGGPPAPAGPAGTFAALLAAVNAATQPGGKAVAPPGGGATATQVPDVDALLALLAGLTAAPPGEDMAGPTETTTMPLLDRPAGVEALPTGNEPGSAALEALMAALLLARPQPVPTEEHSLPGGDLVLLDVTAASAAIASMAADGDQAARTLPVPVAPLGTPDDTGMPVPVTAQVAAVADTVFDAGTAPTLEAPAAPAPLTAADAPETSVATPAPTVVDGTEADAFTHRFASLDGREATVSSPDATAVTRPQREAADVRRQTSGVEGAVTATPLTASTPEPAGVAPRAESVTRTVPANAPAEVAETVSTAVINGDTEVHLRLDPPELGTLDVHIERQDGAIRIRVEASQASSRDLIERALPALQQALESRDLRVERLEVRSMSESASGRSTADQGGQFGRGGQPPQQDGTPEWSPVAAMEGVLREASRGGGQRMDGRPSGGLDVMA